MSWYTLRMDGLMIDGQEQRPINLLCGTPSLENMLCRLHHHLEAKLDAGRGRAAEGLRAAIVAQLALGQWDCWASYRAVEVGIVPLPPTIASLARSTLLHGNFSPEGSTPQASPGSSPTS